MAGALKFWNGEEDIIIGGNKAKVDVSSTAPESPKLGDLWFDTSEPMVIPSLANVVNISVPIKGYVNNKVTISIEGVFSDDLIIGDLRTAELDITAKESILEEYGKILEITAIDGGFEIIVTEAPSIEVPLKMVVIHK